jgi:enoyl-CoA hydratase
MATKNEAEGLVFGQKGAEAFRKLEDLPIPTIAAINGFALGGGCEIAMACDIRYASKNAKFGQPEVGLGIIPGFSGTYRLPKLVGQGMAKELIYSGKTIRSDEALRIGLVNAVYEQEQLMPAVLTLAEQIRRNAPIAVRYAKECINRNYDMDRADGLAIENELFARCFATEDQKNGMAAFLNKKEATFKGK